MANHGQHSGDGNWWWTGSQWLPARSQDGQWWFNGSSWIRANRAHTLPKPTALEWRLGIAWAVLWALALVWWGMLDASRPEQGEALSSGLLRSGLALGVLVLAYLPASGYALARARRWPYVGALVLYISALLILLYVIAMLTAPTDGGTSNDTAASAGVVLLAIPTLLLVAVCVGLGAGASALVGVLSHWRSRAT
ncbi:MAG TPA: hypothetical protein VHW64_04625 [Nocardioides sp.]|uniref:hypothetical protein n=1 Tax=Nocardioides sp. TaxID=35761 RepID=UPI002E3608C3|nr:hypothetical protein [Nocardioides sp.]HEX3929963.1 hypothetical protein [Nocardioides sp.]